MKMKILAVVAHCRDAYDMIGGTMANHVERGDQVTVAVISAENYSDALRLKDEVNAGRKELSDKNVRRESKVHRECMIKACSILGVKDVRFIRQEGILIKFDPGVANRVAELIQEVRPHILVTHHPNENTGIGDHPACGRAAMDGAWLASCLRPNAPLPHSVAQTFFFCPPGETTRLDWEAVNRFPAIQIDITRQVKKKFEAISCLETQYASPDGAAKELEMVSGQAALHSRISYMEAFQAYRPEIYEHLPVSERSLALAETSAKAQMDQVRLIAPYLPGVQEAAAAKRKRP